MKTSVIIESLDLTEATLDADKRTVRQRIITAGTSKNNRNYSEVVLQKATSLFEGVKTYANHPSRAEQKERPERSVRDVTGWISEVEYKDGALWGTRHFTRTQAGNDAWVIVEDIIANKAPANLIGASINAVGKARQEKDSLIVESIEHVISVDDVTTPAAGGGFTPLLMSGDEMLTAVMQSLTFEEWRESRTDYLEQFKKEHKSLRLEDETKAALAEADRKVKAANDEAGQLQQALEDAQAKIAELTTLHEAAHADTAQVRRELAIEKAMVKAQLPQSWKSSLRKRLLEAETDKWESIIDEEQSKARTAHKPSVAVTGAGQQVNQPIAEASIGRSTPDWQEILKSPESFAAWKAHINRSN